MPSFFHHPDYEGAASARFADLRQGNKSVVDYSVPLPTLTADDQWNDAALCSVFFRD